MRYDLELAARCLLGLGQGALGRIDLSEEQRRFTLNVLCFSLRATSHLTEAEIDTVRRHVGKLDQNS